MKRTLLTVFAAVMLAGALAVAGDSVAVVANTNGAIVIEVDGIPQDILFVSIHGELAAISVGECERDKDCSALADALQAAGKLAVLNLKGSKPT